MEYRCMAPGDYGALMTLWLSCPGMGLNDVDDSPEGIARFLTRNPRTCFVAEDDGRLVGCIMAGHDGRRGYIYHTAVHPDWRHRGVAKALVHAALDALAEEQISKVALVAFSRNEAGNAFWEKLGFTRRDDLTYRNLALRELKRRDT